MTTKLEKTRPDDVLGNLSPEQQNTILDWCEDRSFRAVLQKMAAAPPDGMGLEVHYTSLRRFYLKHFAERFVSERSEAMSQLAAAAEDAENADLTPFWLLTKESLEKAIFTRLQKDEFNQRDVTALLRMALRMEDQRLKWSQWMNDCDRVKIEYNQSNLRREQVQDINAIFAAMTAAKAQAKPETRHKD